MSRSDVNSKSAQRQHFYRTNFKKFLTSVELQNTNTDTSPESISSPEAKTRTFSRQSFTTQTKFQGQNSATSPFQTSNPNQSNPLFSFVLQNFETFNPPETYQKFIATIRYLLNSYKQIETLKSVIYTQIEKFEQITKCNASQISGILKQVVDTLQSDLELAILLAQNLVQELLSRIDYNNGKLKDQIFQVSPPENNAASYSQTHLSGRFSNSCSNDTSQNCAADHPTNISKQGDQSFVSRSKEEFDQCSVSSIPESSETAVFERGGPILEESNQDSALGTTMGTGKTSLTRNPSVASVMSRVPNSNDHTGFYEKLIYEYKELRLQFDIKCKHVEILEQTIQNNLQNHKLDRSQLTRKFSAMSLAGLKSGSNSVYASTTALNYDYGDNNNYQGSCYSPSRRQRSSRGATPLSYISTGHDKTFSLPRKSRPEFGLGLAEDEYSDSRERGGDSGEPSSDSNPENEKIRKISKINKMDSQTKMTIARTASTQLTEVSARRVQRIAEIQEKITPKSSHKPEITTEKNTNNSTSINKQFDSSTNTPPKKLSRQNRSRNGSTTPAEIKAIKLGQLCQDTKKSKSKKKCLRNISTLNDLVDLADLREMDDLKNTQTNKAALTPIDEAEEVFDDDSFDSNECSLNKPVGKPVLGRPGIPGSNDLDSTIERLTMRDRNKLCTSNEGDLYNRRAKDNNKDGRGLRHTATEKYV